MNPHAPYGAAGTTNMHPAMLAALVLAIILVFFLPRKYVVVPLLLLSILVPVGQIQMIGPFHFQLSRLLLFFVWIRLVWQRYAREGRSSKVHINTADKIVMGYCVFYVVAFTFLWKDSQAFFDAVGKLYNVGGFYFAFRFFIRDREDVERVIKSLALIAVIVAVLMCNEQLTGRNFLAMFGGVPAHTFVRQGYLRSQGPFEAYLTAGVFGATLIPLFLILIRKGSARLMGYVGLAAALIITVTSHTSTAVSACGATLIGCGMWFFRGKMRQVRWGLVLSILGLDVVMKAPVWSLIARIDLVGGSTGYQRFLIIDSCIRHFWDWWLVGAQNYATWAGEDDMWDSANQYVAIANTSGLLCLIFFLAAIVYCFKYLGNARKAAGENSSDAWFFWLLGVALFANLIAFLGISYFDQTYITWYALIAMIVAATGARQKAFALEPEPAPGPSLRKVPELGFGRISRSPQGVRRIHSDTLRISKQKN
jgi:hypothetical protein